MGAPSFPTILGFLLNLLNDVWTDLHDKAFTDIKEGVANAVKLAHVRDDATLCLFTDASDLFYGAILTQIPADILTTGPMSR